MTNSKPLERNIEKKCVEYAEAVGMLSIKLDKAKRSWPDRLFIGPHGMMLVEFKRPGQKPRVQQLANHRKLFALGYVVHVVDSVDQFIDILTRNGYVP